MVRSPLSTLFLPLLIAAPLAAQIPDRIQGVACHHQGKQNLEVVVGSLRLPRTLAGASLRPAPGEHGLVLPLLLLERDQGGAQGDFLRYRVLALRRGKAPEARLELLDGQGAVVAHLAFANPTAQSPDPEPVRTWLRARAWGWSARSGPAAPLGPALLAAATSAYGDLLLPRAPRAEPRETEHGPSLLALLGGRAAVEETLQLDRPLSVDQGHAGPSLALADLKGIETPAHPWAQLRAAQTAGQRLPLADCVPLDRALLYLPKPKAALASLEGGGGTFLQRLSSFAGQGGLDTTIVTRILEDLGLGQGRGRRLIESGAIQEALLFFPDLAFMSGTEATVVADLNREDEADFIPRRGVHSLRTAGGMAVVARRGTRIFLSTSRAELERALALSEAGGAQSLGRSDEFAVVLGKLSPDPDTELFAYLPDAFIRGLVGPRQRILQARQSQARVRMEGLAGAALLRRLDAPGEALKVDRLRALGYLPKDLDLSELSLSADGRVQHAQFGPLERLLPLARLPLSRVSAAEAEAYEQFREGYSQYWRRYFDPLALRLDHRSDGSRTLETFLLPLLDSSIYGPLRTFLTTGETLPQPLWTRPMVVELGLRLALPGLEQTRSMVPPLAADSLLRHCTGVVAMAFPDSAPVLQLGNGSPATLLDADFTGRGLVGMGALALGAFTRPVVLALELKDPAATRKALADLGSETLLGQRLPGELECRLSREPDGRLQLRVGLLGLVHMRFTGQVQDRWLVLSNDASLASPLVKGTQDRAPFAAAFTIHPEALKQGLASAFAAAMEGEQSSAFAAITWLAPWLQVEADVAAAQAASHRLLGLAPLLEPQALAPGSRLQHRRFGSPERRRLPALDPAQDFGLLEGIREGRVETRIEDDGLRARVTWN